MKKNLCRGFSKVTGKNLASTLLDLRQSFGADLEVSLKVKKNKIVLECVHREGFFEHHSEPTPRIES